MIIDVNKLSTHNMKKLKLYLHIKEKNRLFDLMLGGSLSLIIQDVIPERIVNDLDVCYFKFFHLNFTNVFKADSVISYTLNKNKYWTIDIDKDFQGEKIDLFIDLRARFFKYKCEIDGKTEYLNLQFPSEIMEAKMIYLHRGARKHLDDLVIYLNQLKNKLKDNSKKNIKSNKIENDIANGKELDEEFNLLEDDCIVSKREEKSRY